MQNSAKAFEGVQCIWKMAFAAVALHAAPLEAQTTSQSRSFGTVTVEKVQLPTGMRTYGDFVPPRGAVDFCRREADACEAMDAAPGIKMQRKELNDEELAYMWTLNTEINSVLIPSPDKETHESKNPQFDYWRIAQKGDKADCEDFALTKRDWLLRRGWGPHQLLMTVVYKADGGHAILTVRTNKGDYVLDNTFNDVLLWHQAAVKGGYLMWMGRQSYDDPKRWLALDPRLQQK